LSEQAMHSRQSKYKPYKNHSLQCVHRPS